MCNEQIAIHGRSQKAVLETIRICKDRDVLAEYLGSKEKEVVDIMMVLYDEQEVMRSYVESEVYEATQEATQNAKIEIAKRFLRMNKLSYEEIAAGSELTIEEVEKLAGLESY